MSDMELTKKELIALVRKKEQEIKELEEKLDRLTHIESSKYEVKKVSYEEMVIRNNRLMTDVERLYETNVALTESLRLVNQEKIKEIERADMLEIQYESENARANKLYDELEQLREKDRFNSIGKSSQYCSNEVMENNE